MSFNFLALLGLTVLAGITLASGALHPGIVTFLFVFLGWIVAVSLHEWGHAVAALAGGDSSIRSKGYLDLDPVRYADPLTSVIFPLLILAMGGIGFPGAAVYIETHRLRGPLWRSIVALAGPAMTGVCLVVLGVPFLLGGPEAFGGPDALWAAIGVLAFLQATGLVLNLLPIPGFDGFAAIAPFLPPGVQSQINRLGPIIMIGALSLILLVPGALAPIFGIAVDIASAFGIDRSVIVEGFANFRFWA